MGTAAALKESGDKEMMPTIDHSVGPEKFELLAKQQGNDDPFFLRTINRADFKGTKADPIIVNALDQYRMVGCTCKEGDTTIQWMWLIAGKDKRCGCGHWFKLKEHAAIDIYDMPA